MQKLMLVLVSLLIATPAFARPGAERRPGAETLYEIVSTTPGFEVLSLALELTGLDELTDSSSVQLTVFAPNNEAFERAAAELGFSDVDALVAFLIEADLLDDVLAYHVVEGRRFANSVVNRNRNKPLRTLLGQRLTSTPDATLIDANAMTSDAGILLPNISASNGVAHAIDNVVVPEF